MKNVAVKHCFFGAKRETDRDNGENKFPIPEAEKLLLPFEGKKLLPGFCLLA
jgi:hypothetical protein